MNKQTNMSAVDKLLADIKYRRQQAIKLTNETVHEPNLYCPHCAEEMTGFDLGEIGLSNESDVEERVTCPYCGEQFYAQWHHSFSSRINNN